MRFFSCLFVLLLYFLKLSAQVTYNGDIESVDKTGNVPKGWVSNDPGIYKLQADSVVKQRGKFSLSIQKFNNGKTALFADYVIPHAFRGSTIQLRFYAKTKSTHTKAVIHLQTEGESHTDDKWGSV